MIERAQTETPPPPLPVVSIETEIVDCDEDLFEPGDAPPDPDSGDEAHTVAKSKLGANTGSY